MDRQREARYDVLSEKLKEVWERTQRLSEDFPKWQVEAQEIEEQTRGVGDELRRLNLSRARGGRGGRYRKAQRCRVRLQKRRRAEMKRPNFR